MSYYVVGIGGTGAKCIEALVHLSAAGLIADSKQLFALFVDTDGSNGSLGRAQTLLQNYKACQEIRRGATDLFKTPIRIARPDVWSPIDDKPARLDQFFRYDTLSQSNKGIAHLFDILYSNDEKRTTLEKGFRGHPSIGAAVMAATVKLDQEEPWKTFRDLIALDVRTGEGATVILCGSIFGGTGASGVPTIARLITEEFKSQFGESRFRIGGILMLPYFSFDKVQEQGIKADAEDFLLSTQAALNYYHQQNTLDVFDAVYLMGSDSLTPMTASSLGGPAQKNEPHQLELYAALAAINFLNNEVRGYPMVAREQNSRVTWEDLPYAPGFAVLKQRIDELARFTFAYLSAYYPMLEDIKTKGGGYRAPWYINFFQRTGIDLKTALDAELKQVKIYCESFLQWLANVEFSISSANADNKENLVNYLPFARVVKDEGGKQVVRLKPDHEFDTAAFTNLLHPLQEEKSEAMTELWQRLSESSPKITNAEGVGTFVNALYHECKVKLPHESTS
jgi:hypothetical protein